MTSNDSEYELKVPVFGLLILFVFAHSLTYKEKHMHHTKVLFKVQTQHHLSDGRKTLPAKPYHGNVDQ